jgi:uncharacterized repeat protein (TIGR03833 family)
MEMAAAEVVEAHKAKHLKKETADVTTQKEEIKMDGTRRADVKSGLKVRIVLKADQRTGKLTEGVVKDLLTNSPTHPHGIKVRLMSGEVGRVKEIL